LSSEAKAKLEALCGERMEGGFTLGKPLFKVEMKFFCNPEGPSNPNNSNFEKDSI
jgi:hypothetical protein